jgi:hypothetical protein
MRFPYGIADFQALINEGYFYVDRTDRIPLIENAGKQLLFLRPRPSARACGCPPWRTTTTWPGPATSSGCSGA